MVRQSLVEAVLRDHRDAFVERKRFSNMLKDNICPMLVSKHAAVAAFAARRG